MNHGSLFSGIGGFDLAAEWMGWNNIFHCEWNPFGQKVLKHHFPNSISYADITKTDFTIHRGGIDIITGGFPCQPYSTAGKRLGKSDERHLFPEMLRAIKEIKPRWIIGENVRGLVSWGGGLVFHEVYDDLEREGYEVLSFLIPAASVNAPHRRDRIWFVAYACGSRLQTNNIMRKSEGKEQLIRVNGENVFTANTNSERLQRGQKIDGWQEHNSEWSGVGSDPRTVGKTNSRYTQCDFKKFPTVSPICIGDDGLSNRLDSITFPKWRNESIKAGGNAIVPQVAYQIFKTIQTIENETN